MLKKNGNKHQNTRFGISSLLLIVLKSGKAKSGKTDSHRGFGKIASGFISGCTDNQLMAVSLIICTFRTIFILQV